jgi:hypothetical protein
MLSFMYSGWNKDTMPQIAGKLYEIAHVYDVKLLLTDTEAYLNANISDNNICTILQLSRVFE